MLMNDILSIILNYFKHYIIAQQGLALTIKGLATQPDPHKRPSRKTLKPDPIEEP